jgi:hypothetical protein
MSLNPIPFTPTDATCSFEFGLALRVIAGNPIVEAAKTDFFKKARRVEQEVGDSDMDKPTQAIDTGFRHRFGYPLHFYSLRSFQSDTGKETRSLATTLKVADDLLPMSPLRLWAR